MTEQEFEEFIKELNALMRKYEIKNAAFTGSGSQKYIGLLCLPKDAVSGITEIMLSVSNIGRLWQHARTVVRTMLDDFEGK